ncbi:MAG: hypothetical protein LUC43_08560, partial [Burkholderiales bacterium]|nr:hypothetical protein [Burkholderiales bacterium]
MLKKFAVQNFRQFNSLELDFSNVREYESQADCLTKKGKTSPSLVKTALIYGPNASGKTNLGFAMFDIVPSLHDTYYPIEEFANYTNADHPNESVCFSYTFLLDGEEILYEYSKVAPKLFLSEKLAINGELLFLWDIKQRKENFEGLAKYRLDKLNWKQFPLDREPRQISFIRY